MNFLNQRVKFLYLNLQTVAAYTELKATKFVNRGGLEIPLAALRLSYTYNFTYLFMNMLCFCCCEGFSVVVASKDYSLVGVLRLLITVTSLVAEHRV